MCNFPLDHLCKLVHLALTVPLRKISLHTTVGNVEFALLVQHQSNNATSSFLKLIMSVSFSYMRQNKTLQKALWKLIRLTGASLENKSSNSFGKMKRNIINII